MTVKDKLLNYKNGEFDAVVLFKTIPVMHLDSMPRYAFRALAKVFEIRNFSNQGKARISYPLLWFTMIIVVNNSFYFRQVKNFGKNC